MQVSNIKLIILCLCTIFKGNNVHQHCGKMHDEHNYDIIIRMNVLLE